MNSCLRILVCVCLVCAGAACESEPQSSGPPNLIIFFADDLGWKDVGYHGSEIHTPSIDSLVREGMDLNRCYAFPSCSPSRSALMTGRSPFRHGILYSAIRPHSKYGLPLEEVTFGEHMQAAGYATYLVGKWHLGHARQDQHPNARGFDHFYGHLTGAIDYFEHLRDGGLDWQRNGKAVREKGYSTNLFAKEAVDVIRKRDKSKPFFLYMPFNAPHVPLMAPPAYGKRYEGIADRQRQVFAAMVDAMDTAMGKVLEALEEEGIEDNTLVLFLSDNGGAVPEGSVNTPLRGGKFDLTDGGLRVPAALRWPGHVEAGSRSEQVISIMDLLPTLAGAMDIPLSNSGELDGRNLWAQIEGGSTLPPEGLTFGAENSGGLAYSVLDGDWKLIRSFPKQGGPPRNLLYRIFEDPYEKRDLAGENPQVVERLAEFVESARSLEPANIARWDQPPPDGWKAPADWAAAMKP